MITMGKGLLKSLLTVLLTIRKRLKKAEQLLHICSVQSTIVKMKSEVWSNQNTRKPAQIS